MTKAQKRILVDALLGAAGDMVENHPDNIPELSDVPASEIAAQLAQWLKRLPGDSWDKRLPDPSP